MVAANTRSSRTTGGTLVGTKRGINHKVPLREALNDFGRMSVTLLWADTYKGCRRTFARGSYVAIVQS